MASENPLKTSGARSAQVVVKPSVDAGNEDAFPRRGRLASGVTDSRLGSAASPRRAIKSIDLKHAAMK